MTTLADGFPLDEFRIVATLGRGEFGTVHRAAWTTRQLDVALKQIPKAQGDAKLEAERGGARLQALVWERHSDIVPRVYVEGTGADGDYYIAMEFVRGESLQDLLRRTRLTAAQSVRLTAMIAGALHRLHAFDPPILHADLKPEHVLVLDDGSIRIIDFGIAKRPEAGAATHNAFVSIMYAAPERIEDEARNVHPSDDLWALGVMGFEMLAGRHPREAYRARIEDAVRREDLATVAMLLRERPGMLPAECSPQLDAIVRKLLAPQPGHRYPGATALLADLTAYTAGRETMAWQQLLAAGRATRIVTRRASAPAGAPTLVVPPPLPASYLAASRGVASPAPVVASPPPVIASPPIAASPSVAAPPSRGIASAARVVAPPATRAGLPAPTVPPSPARPRRGTRPAKGVVIRAIAALLLARVIVGEGVVWNRTERFRHRIDAFQVEDLPSIPPMVRSLRDGALIGFAASGADEPLSARMLALAEPTLRDYRNDVPTARLPQWKTANAALALALDATPDDRRVRSRARYVDGHLLRIAAQGKAPGDAAPLLERSVAAFRDAARLDNRWPDPWVALATVQAYGLRDVDAVIDAVREAARRGFSSGRRERAEIADAFAYRADQARISAADVAEDERRQLLTAAAADYEGCVDNYAGVVGFFNSDQNADRCRRLLASVHETLSAPVDPPADTATISLRWSTAAP